MKLYPWQQSQWRAMTTQYQQNRLPHALLLQGPVGLGKLNFAACFAAWMLCDNKGEEACGSCRSCRLVHAESHPDFYSVAPQEKSKSIKVDQIRDLMAALNQTSLRKGWQVVIIHPAEAMNRASSNALLKTLEEPSGQVCLILVANQSGLMPATLLSRCQRVYFSEPLISLTKPWLQQQLAIGEQEATALLHLSAGAPLHALAMGKNHYLKLRDNVLGALWQLDQGERLATTLASELLKQEHTVVLQIIFSLAMDVARVGLGLPSDTLANRDILQQLQKIQGKVNLLLLMEWLPQLLLAMSRAQTVASINIQLLMESVLLQWQKIRANYVS